MREERKPRGAIRAAREAVRGPAGGRADGTAPEVEPEARGWRDVDGLFAELREECASPPAAPGFVAGFRARRDAWLERAGRGAPWRPLALRLAPAGALAAVAALVVILGSGTPRMAPETPAASEAAEYAGPFATAPEAAEYADPFAAGLEEAGVATVATIDDEAGYELLAVLYEPMGGR